MNRSAHAASSEKRFIRGVKDGVNFEQSNVTEIELDISLQRNSEAG